MQTPQANSKRKRNAADSSSGDSEFETLASRRQRTMLPQKKAGKSGGKSTVGETLKETAQKSTRTSAQKTSEKSPGKSAGKPAGKSPGKSAGKPAGKSPGKSAGKPTGKSPGKPAGKPARASRRGFQGSRRSLGVDNAIEHMVEDSDVTDCKHIELLLQEWFN
jgi:hypothetical protein